MPNPTLDLSDVLQRLAELQAEIDGVRLALPGFTVLPSQYPAFVNRVGAGVHDDAGAGLVNQRWTIHMRLLVGTMENADYARLEPALHRFMKTVPLFFAARRRLQTASKPALLGRPVELGTCGGVQWFIDGLLYQHLGAEFPLTLTLPWQRLNVH
jgi:hypothetical protein